LGSFGVGFAEVNCRADSARVCVDILDHQGTSFGNPTSGVETNSEQRAIASGLQTFVEQKLDFLLREYFGLAVPFYFHAWYIPNPIPESLPQILHYCIVLGVFLINAAALLRSGIVRR
jgi:hypothetical protein